MYEYVDEKHDDQYMVAIGDPFNGISFYGPFQYMDEANDWVTDIDPSEDWWIVELSHPLEREKEWGDDGH